MKATEGSERPAGRYIAGDPRLAKPGFGRRIGAVRLRLCLAVESQRTVQPIRLSAHWHFRDIEESEFSVRPHQKASAELEGEVRYQFVVDVGVDPETGKRKQLKCTFDSLKEAKAEYANISHRRNQGSFVRPHKITVNEWLDRWLAMKADDLEEATLYSYTTTLDRVRGKLGKILLQDLSEEHVEEWRDWALKQGRVRGKRAGMPLSVTSVDMSLARLKDALGRAVTRRLVYVNVAEHVTIPRRARKEERKAKEEVRPWNVQEVQTFVHGIREERLYAALLLSLMGLRPAEVCGLRWEDVDLENANDRHCQHAHDDG
ncbi:Arm DNA-binding domain-containing protein [Streptomyces longispororuber]|uniref:Arm DNA-binding domain-containing protein n=1 Tax=Streptomyces longispororuber TaxID=68230 RepID=UPI0036FB08E9